MPDAYICDYRRTPIGRFAGALSSIRADDLAAVALKSLMARNPTLPSSAIDEIVMGCANQAGEDNRNVARMSSLLAGLPTSVPAITVNRLCASGMDAVIMAARGIRAGEIELTVAGGVESMSRAPFVMPKAQSAFSRDTQIFDTTLGWRFVNPLMQQQYGIDSMPETAENVAEKYEISRQDQDAFAYRSQQKAAEAQKIGRLAKEIEAVRVAVNRGADVLVDTDEHPRISSMEKLGALRTPFRQSGTVTAANASGVNDGAAAMLLASEDAVTKYNLAPLARVMGGAAAGVEPSLMGMGPVPAVQRLCAKLKLRISDFDVVEINEAFASQGLACLRELGIDEDAEHVNPNGGAIALGHPLGMSGTRIVGTAAMQLQQVQGRYALATMCVGVGQGVAIALESV